MNDYTITKLVAQQVHCVAEGWRLPPVLTSGHFLWDFRLPLVLSLDFHQARANSVCKSPHSILLWKSCVYDIGSDFLEFLWLFSNHTWSIVAAKVFRDKYLYPKGL